MLLHSNLLIISFLQRNIFAILEMFGKIPVVKKDKPIWLFKDYSLRQSILNCFNICVKIGTGCFYSHLRA